MGLTGSSVVSLMFRSFQRSCLPREIQPPDWNLFRLRCFSRPLFSASQVGRRQTTGRCPFYLLLCWPRGLASCTAFPLWFIICAVGSSVLSLFFLTTTQNPSVPDSRFEEFSVPSLDDFVGDDSKCTVALSHPGPSEILVPDEAVPSRY